MKKFLSAVLAGALVFSMASVSIFAYTDNVMLDSGVYDEDGDSIRGESLSLSAGSVTGEIPAGKKFYVGVEGAGGISSDDLCDSDDFSFKLDRDENGRLLDTVKLVKKRLGGNGNRQNYIEVKLKENTMIEEKKVTFDVYFKAKRTENGWSSGDTFGIRFSIWINNEVEDGEDGDIVTGDNIVFNPISNERNTITWGGDETIATLEFMANDDAEKFYAKLSTKTDRGVYEEYGDPADADLFFRTFVGNPNIDATSRATLTLYNPWSDYYDDYYRRNNDVHANDVYIYTVDSQGYLTDVTNNFTYVDEDDTDAGIDGWQARVRTLGTYVLSDTNLDIYGAGNGDDSISTDDPQTPKPEQVPVPKPAPAPPTGSRDLVAVAAVMAVLSASVFAVARKRK